MTLYNTLTHRKEIFKPMKKGVVLMYHCGPTVYWTQHIGNMRAMVLCDLIVRTFKYLNYKIKLVRNYTDVGHLSSDGDEGEDKIEKAALQEKLNPKKIAEKYIKIFEQDINALNVQSADKKPRATECIDDIIKMIQALLNKGYAYPTDLAIYFNVSKAKNYTQLSRQNLDELIKDAGKAEISDPAKKSPLDFALWFFKTGKHKNALQTWYSPFSSPIVKNGQGFPGWHIECSVIAKKYLGKTIDLHMGGVEHIPIHHTNEIAQSEAANDAKFVNYWLHNEHLLVNGTKMSKSQGTAHSLKEIIDKKFEPLTLRYFFLQAHYRSKQNFTWKALGASAIAVNKLYDFLKYQSQRLNTKTPKHLNTTMEYKDRFREYISDDFNIPAALALVWEMIKDNQLAYLEKKKLILDFDKVFGLNLDKIKPEKIKIPAEVMKLVKEREKARAEKNWKLADELRKKIYDLGFKIEDGENGTGVAQNKNVKVLNI